MRALLLRGLGMIRLIIFFILSLCLPVSAETVQVKVLGDLAISTSTDVFFSIEGSSGSDTPNTDREGVAASAGRTTRLKACLSADPANGAGVQSVTLTLQVAGVASAATVTITESDGDLCETWEGSVAYAAGDTLNYIQTAANTPTAAQINARIWLTDDTHNETIYMGGSGGTALSGTVTQYMSIASTNGVNTTESSVAIPMPFDGTIKGLYADLTTAPANGGGTQTRTFTVMIDGVASSCTCSISEAGLTCNDVVNQCAFTAGQTLTFRSTVSNTPAGSTVHLGIVVANTVGGFAIVATNAANMSAADTEYHRFHGNPAWTTTENSRFQYYPAMQVRATYVKLNGSPDNGGGTQTYTFTAWDDGSPLGCSCVISEAETSCNDTCTDDVADGSRMAYEKVPASTPTARIAGISSWVFVTSERRRQGQLVGG